MGRRPLGFLVLLAAAGCGGHAASHGSTTTTPVTPVATLGSALLDLGIANPSKVVASTAMVGTGSATGSLAIVDAGPVQAGTVDVRAVLQRNGFFPDGNLTQTLSLHLAHAKALAVGDAFTIDGAANTAQYVEATLVTSGMFVNEGGTTTWPTATGGTVTVTALSGPTVTLSLTSVALTQGDPYPNPIAVSGTVVGTLTYPPI